MQHRGKALALAVTLAVVGLPAGVASATGENLLTGTVLDPNGKPLAGANVIVTHLPSEVTDKGEEAPIAQGVTNSLGRFAIDLRANPAMVEQALFNDGAVNLQVMAEKVIPAEPAPQSEPETADTTCADDPVTVLTDHAESTIEDPNLDPDIGPEQVARPCSVPAPSTTTPTDVTYSAVTFTYVTLKDAGVFEPHNEVAGAVLSMADPVTLETIATPAAKEATDDEPKCANYAPDREVIDRNVPLEPFAELHVGWDSSARIDYGRTANTDLGGAYSYKGGAYEVTAGATHMGNKGTGVSAFRGAFFGNLMRTQFEYITEKLTFYAAGNVPCRTDYRVRAIKWTGIGMDEGRNVREKDGGVEFTKAEKKKFYGEFGTHTGWTKNQGRGEKYTFDVKAFGLSLHAQSSWSTNLDLSYSFGGGTQGKHYLFAQDEHPSTSKNVYAW